MRSVVGQPAVNAGELDMKESWGRATVWKVQKADDIQFSIVFLQPFNEKALVHLRFIYDSMYYIHRL